MFARINPAQWLWYMCNFSQDRDEQFEVKRDLVEYHAGFLAPELVEHVRNSRDEPENAPLKGIGTNSDQEFSNTLGEWFGKTLPFVEDNDAQNEHRESRADIDYEHYLLNKAIQQGPKLNYKHWLEFDLE